MALPGGDLRGSSGDGVQIRCGTEVASVRPN